MRLQDCLAPETISIRNVMILCLVVCGFGLGGLPQIASAQNLADGLTGAVTTQGDHTAPSLVQTKHALAAGAMVVTAHPLATQAGIDILSAGGRAADAAVAIQAVLTLVEPQSSGFGGGAFALHWSGDSLLLDSYDGRETAPRIAGGDLFLDATGQPLPFMQAVIGGRAVGTPGTLRLLEKLHQDHGQLAWADLLQPARDMAREGFRVSPRLHQSITAVAPSLRADPVAAEYFLDAGSRPWPVGHRLQNPAYADLLDLLMRDGVTAFYAGDIAQAIVDKVRDHPTNPGFLALEDLSRYQAIRRAPVCQAYRSYEVCGMGPPSSGGLTVAQILTMLEGFDLDHTGADASHRRHHLYAEAAKRAYADRARYTADGDLVPVPRQALMNRDYLQRRAASIDPMAASIGPAHAGDWPGKQLIQAVGGDATQKDTGTTHFIVVDHAGSIVSYTGSIESAFGARQMVHGILLNNQLTDFSFRPTADDGTLVANRVQPGKRPRSSMAPTIVFDSPSRPLLALGSPGGSRIINYVAMAIIHILDQGLPPGDAFAQAHLGSRNGPLEVEQGAVPEATIDALRAMGHEVVARPMVSGLHGVMILSDQLLGGADPRREGHVQGLP